MRDKRSKHFDAWGNPILDRFKMAIYYRDSPTDLFMVTHYLPHQYVVIPHVEIRIYTGIDPVVEMTTLFPGGEITKILRPTPKMWVAFRETWKGKKGWMHDFRGHGQVVLVRRGKVILDPARKYGSAI